MSKYNQVQPMPMKATYNANDNVDFTLSFENNFLLPNSIRLSGMFNVLNAGVAVDPQVDKVYYDANIGIHGMFSSIITTSDKLGTVENITNYGRVVKQHKMCTQTTSQIVSESTSLNELCVGHDLLTVNVLTQPTSFSFAPDFCLNNMINDMQTFGALDYNKTGNIKVSVRVASILEALFGATAPVCTINFTDLKLDYVTVPMSPTKQSLYVTREVITQTISNTQSSFATNVPSGTCRSMSGSFLAIAHNNAGGFNNYELEEPTGGISKVYFSYKDSTDGFVVAYPLESQQDILLNFIRSYSSAMDNKNSASLGNWQMGKFYGVGIAFLDDIDLSNDKFTITLTTGIQQVAPFYLYLIFTSVRVV